MIFTKKKLNFKTKSHRKSIIRNLIVSVFLFEKLETKFSLGKEVNRNVNKIYNLVHFFLKKGNIVNLYRILKKKLNINQDKIKMIIEKCKKIQSFHGNVTKYIKIRRDLCGKYIGKITFLNLKQ